MPMFGSPLDFGVRIVQQEHRLPQTVTYRRLSYTTENVTDNKRPSKLRSLSGLPIRGFFEEDISLVCARRLYDTQNIALAQVALVNLGIEPLSKLTLYTTIDSFFFMTYEKFHYMSSYKRDGYRNVRRFRAPQRLRYR
jgi:hypothetical protein